MKKPAFGLLSQQSVFLGGSGTGVACMVGPGTGPACLQQDQEVVPGPQPFGFQWGSKNHFHKFK